MQQSRLTPEPIAVARQQAETGAPVVRGLGRRGIAEQTLSRWTTREGGRGTGERRRLKPPEAAFSRARAR